MTKSGMELDEQEKQVLVEFEEYVGVISRRLTDGYAEKMAELEKEKKQQLDKWHKGYSEEMKCLIEKMKKEREKFMEQFDPLIESKLKNYHLKIMKLVMLMTLLLGLLQVGLFLYGR